jgi:hypothetical protein
MEALNSMGATAAEADAILGRMPEEEDEEESKNWIHNNGVDRVSSPTSPGPEWQEAGLAEGAKNPKDGSGSDTGTKGAQLAEIKQLIATLKEVERLSGVNSPESAKAREDLDLAKRAYDMIDKDPSNSTTYVSKLYTRLLDEFKSGLGGTINWKKFNKQYGTDIHNVGEYTEWFEEKYMSSFNNVVTVDPAAGVTDGGDATKMTRDEAIAWLIENNEGITDKEIEEELAIGGY